MQLAALRKRLNLQSRDIPLDWDSALLNYFASPFDEFSLKHFISKFDTFCLTPLDRYNKPVNHANGGNGNGSHKQTDREKNISALKDFVDRSLAPEVFGDIPHVRENPK